MKYRALVSVEILAPDFATAAQAAQGFIMGQHWWSCEIVQKTIVRLDELPEPKPVDGETSA